MFDDDTVKSCQYYSGYLPMYYQINFKRMNFLKKNNAGHCDTNSMKSIQQCHFDLSELEIVSNDYGINVIENKATCKWKL